jgi:hypothetical protein
VADTNPGIVHYRAAALTGILSKIAVADLTPEGYKRIAQAVCDLAQAVADEESDRHKRVESQQNRRY